MKDKPYWHKVMTEDVLDKLIVDRPDMRWKDILFEYKQPDWCSYPYALQGKMGCWSLALRPFRIHCIEDCEGCECVKTKYLPLDRRVTRYRERVVAWMRRLVCKVKRLL